jgi:hypothetical protein
MKQIKLFEGNERAFFLLGFIIGIAFCLVCFSIILKSL